MTAAAAKTDVPGYELLQPCDKPVIILFHTSWSDPCKTAVPEVEKELAAQTDKAGRGKFRLVKIDVDKYGEMANAFGVNSIPTLVGFHGDRASYGAIGRQPQKILVKFFSEVEKFHKENPPPAWMIPPPEPAPAVSVDTGRTIRVMKPLKLGQKKEKFKWIR
jgi:thiol-disulfide isomerase/thioredoxin